MIYIKKPALNFLFVFLITWVGLIIVAPVSAASGKPGLVKASEWIYFFYKPTCHQIPERSFLFHGIPFAVCIRCFSFYVGGLITVIFFMFKKTIGEIRLKWILLLILPAVLDFMLEKTSIYRNLMETRIATGLLLGGCVFYIILLSLCQIDVKKRNVSIQ